VLGLVLPLLAVPIAIFLYMVASGVPFYLALEIIVIAFLLWLNNSVVVSFARRLRIGYVTALLFVPFFVTLPELVTCIVLAQHGYGLASFMNAVFSVVMDLCFTYALFVLMYYYVSRKVLLYTQPQIITLPNAYMVIGLLPPLVLTCMIFDFDKLAIESKLVMDDLWDGVILLSTYIFALVLPVAYMLATRRGQIKIVLPQYESYVPAWRDITIFIISLFSLMFLSYEFAERMDIVCSLLGQKVGGVLAAYLTSIPDAMYALAAFSPRVEEVKESLIELWSSSFHDLTRNISVPVLLYATGANLFGLVGGPLEANLATILAMFIAIYAWLIGHRINAPPFASPRRTSLLVATPRTSAVLLAAFATCTAIGLLM